uniref:Alkaline phosphatase n=1 Tax=Amphora coffeiformis TaxID=265554 RepID=A0A7S3L848_9STRA|mmetsp:Transcript_14842/g.28290  ORF Transcript_14842/g.28290 Transcript_14842/m.28290 type:complete len:354 (+) Transcript_14842:445-1506(+)
MANRLTSLIALMILSAIFLVQFQFNLDGTGNTSASTTNAWKTSGSATKDELKKCKGKLSGSDAMDCAMNEAQSFCTASAISQDLKVPFPCVGDEYNTFGHALKAFANDPATHGDSWGRRAYGLPSNKMILMLGNADTQQVAHSMACQHASRSDGTKVQSVQAPIADDKTAQKITMTNNSTLVILMDNDKVSQATKDGASLAKAVYQETGYTVDQFDGMIWGLFHDCGAVAANCPNTTQPAFDAASQVFDGPMLFISMMADARSQQALAIRDAIREYRSAGRRNLWFISGRRYISKLKLEGATIYGNGDADNIPKTGRYGHRCTGPLGGHADLLAFDVTEFLYHQLFYMSDKTS